MCKFRNVVMCTVLTWPSVFLGTLNAQTTDKEVPGSWKSILFHSRILKTQSFHIEVFKKYRFVERHSGRLLIATPMDLQFSSYGAFVLSTSPL